RKAVPAGAGLVLLAIWCGLTALYATAARAGLQLRSCAVGAAVATVLLVGVLWAFVRFQIGAARVGTVQSGLSAGPVFLLLVYSSWYVTLVGAEVAVGNDVDRTLARGAYAWRLDAVGQSWAALAVMAAVARAMARNAAAAPGAKDLAGEIKLFPGVVDSLCGLLVARGLLIETDPAQYRLSRPAADIAVHDIVDAVNRDPALDAGASGFALKTDGAEALIGALALLQTGTQYLAPSLAERLQAARARRQQQNDLLAVLSPREREIFRLAAQCLKAREIAKELCIARKTADTHLNHIYHKLSLRSMAELVRLAANLGMMDNGRTPSSVVADAV
ncbi:MAG: YhjD/YihY/BrkB family envelope integrity protein, partial [Verrucomicrobiota bacterium]